MHTEGGSVGRGRITASTRLNDTGVGTSFDVTVSTQNPPGQDTVLDITTSSSPGEAVVTHVIPPGFAGRGRAAAIQQQRLELLRGPSSSTGESKVVFAPTRGRGRGVVLDELARSCIARENNRPTAVVVEKEIEKLSLSEDEPKSSEPVIRKGNAGVITNAVTNYIRLQNDPNKGVFQYEVRFSPNVDSRNIRMKLLNEHRSKFGGTKTFDGAILYLPIKLPDKVTIYNSKNPSDGSDIEVRLIFKRKMQMKDCIHLYNVLFDRIMKALQYVRFDRKQYDPSAPKMIPQWKLEIWPGYVTAVDEYEDGIMLCCDVSHRLLNQKTVLETLMEAYKSNPSMYQENAKKALLGNIVLTRYNNNTYRIDDIDFNASPLSTFPTKTGEMSFVDYYEKQYGIHIKDKKQPLLRSIKKQRVAGKEIPEEIIFCLVPEICYLTGLNDEMRADFKVMRDIATFTRVTPNQRVQALQKFYNNVNSSQEAREILSDWGLSLASDCLKVQGRQLPIENIQFASMSCPAGVNADFSRYATNNELLEVVHLTNWLIVHTYKDSHTAKNFMDLMMKNSKPMGINVQQARVVQIANDRTDTFVNALRENCKSDTQIVVCICPTSRDDRYAAIKKVLCVEIPIPSQVINARTLANDTKARSIVQKIALQMNCKLGGTLWSIKIPFKNVMICGIDTFHDAHPQGRSVAAFVASINGNYTRWYSRAIIQTKKEEIVNGLCSSLHGALKQYEKFNGCLPDKIIIFRDGVGDGQLKLCADYEVPQFKEACRVEFKNYEPKITFIVVQKRINTRIFADTGRDLKNPDPGFILDHTVTRRYLYDFFLVSQSVRQGTVTPSHYIVVNDDANFSPDILQRLSYKLCFLYYNWPGTVRVPACCQYAHKMAQLVGQSIKKQTSEKLADKLFYL